MVDSSSETLVIRWMKPAENQFQIEYESGRKYHPDFVIETETELLIVEVKARNEMAAADVLAKARAARRWIYYANSVANEKGKKLWAYLLIPHNEITPSATLAGLRAGWVQPDFEGDE